ncbi:type II toxin-antitoxin system death-on-curing family toxin [Burkholderia ubonensis]|uniref:Death-on-curing protein n=1 Tax=Burkholderia ubonensis TaxID=101571 RepID=A0A119NZ47_9BURK|nr:type II toxin-antitoxin system death-on-curing family toxin [Burkholderia ubonensis]AJX15979.1 toxin doc [Burkholderia ubonensis MSMB22]KVD05486.1 death-on-curing protein [Burkholderia ubonensis]KVD64452.1 death-on-curing protein [Burkholderia ubonensis]KVG38063.1 death-on-curing protein [Burkholderia ubonensis]KVG87059.1 death-on-curing protein [Burkholderia ubonensis]
MLDLDYVITIHDEIIRDLGGLGGFAHGGRGGVEAALHRVENHAHYAGLDDVFGIAATYATAIARGHVFNDANKRTGLTCALTYLEQQGITIPRLADLEEIMVEVADGQVTSEELAEYLSAVWELSQSARFTID